MQTCKEILVEFPFSDTFSHAWCVYHKRLDRYMVSLYSKTYRTTISLAKYRLSIKLGRILSRHEEVDHIDNDKLNDDVDNLQILSRKANQDKSVRCKCEVCGKIFDRRYGQVIWKNNVSKPRFCSRSCETVSKRKNYMPIPNDVFEVLTINSYEG
jgi:hypothetical protein